jgi:hypothetical protein
MTDPTALLGSWTLTRVVDDRLAGERRDVRGTATLEQESPDRIRWREEGTMTWGGRSVPVSRTLYVDRVDGAWTVHFEDGRVFHPWAVGSWVDHPCAPDHYRGLIEVGAASWTVEWQARGPEKDYVMRTEHTRAEESR